MIRARYRAAYTDRFTVQGSSGSIIPRLAPDLAIHGYRLDEQSNEFARFRKFRLLRRSSVATLSFGKPDPHGFRHLDIQASDSELRPVFDRIGPAVSLGTRVERNAS